MKLLDLCSRTTNCAVLLLACLFGFHAGCLAQQKVGTGGDINGFSNSFYTVRFGGPAAYSRGGDGVVTQSGANGFLANPANLSAGERWQLYCDAAVGRNDLTYRPGFLTTLESSFEQPNFSYGSVVAAFAVDRFTCGLALSRPRQYTNTIRMTWYDSQHARSWHEITQPEIREWQLSAGLATNVLPHVRFGVSAHLVRLKLLFYETFMESPVEDYQDAETIGLFQIGLKADMGPLLLALSLRSPEDFSFWRDGKSDLLSNELPSKVPAELSFGALYRNLLSAEFKTLILDDDMYEHDFRQIGGGLHVPLVGLLKHPDNYLNLGVMHRTNPKYYGEDVNQTFLIAGLEIGAGPFDAYASWINGKALNDTNIAVSEFILGLKYRSH